MRIPSLTNALLILIVGLAAAGCNLPSSAAESPTPDITQVYQTVQARVTQNASLTGVPSATLAPTATSQPSPSPTTGSLLPTATRRPEVQPTQAANVCDQAAPGVPIDVTIPDDTRMTPGQAFTKTWRLVNTGTCAWSPDYTIALFSGEAMSAPAQVKLPNNVAPGGSVDISVDLAAPQTAGAYQGNWKLKNAAGAWFGIGPNGSSPFWVRIVVAGTAVSSVTPTATQGTAYPGGNPNPTVLISGSSTMIPGDHINLDSNALNTGAGEDLAFQLKENGKLVRTPLSSGVFAGVGRGTPTLDSCAAAPLGAGQLKIEDLGQGQYICYRTDQGLVGYLRLLGLNDQNNTLGFEMLTWAQP